MSRKTVSLVVLCLFGAAWPAMGAEPPKATVLQLTVKGGGVTCANVPVCARIELPKDLAQAREGVSAELKPAGEAPGAVPCQVLKAGDGKAELWWILPRVEAGKQTQWTATLSRKQPQPARSDQPGKPAKDGQVFSWQDTQRDHLDLLFAARPVIRYMYAFDTSTPQRAHETYKVYHHVFDGEGKGFITKGPGGQYTHHRGIFIGWNKVAWGADRGDFWHMKGINQAHSRLLETVAGPVLGRMTAQVRWNDAHRRPVLEEQRTVTVFRQPAPAMLLLDFRTELKPAGDWDVVLDGDPEHAGVHFRAHDDLSKGTKGAGGKVVTSRATYLFGKEKLDPRKVRDLPWAAMSFILKGKHYTVQHVNHPDNPKQTRYSAYRPYGRFGAFCRTEVKAGKTLTLRYRIRVTEGQAPSREQMGAVHAAFAAPPEVQVKK